MKEIKAIIRPSKLMEVTEELHRIDGLPGVSVMEISGFGKRRSAVEEMVELVERVQLEVVVDDAMVEEIVNVIQKYSHTGNTGDGKIFISTVDDVVKIRTNERGKDAL